MTHLRFALRQLLKSPGFTAVAVLTLALGIGATTAIFSVVNAVVLRPLPYLEPDRLVRIYSEFPGFPNGGLRRFAVSTPEYLELKRETKSWETLDAWNGGGVNVGSDTHPRRTRGAGVTGDLFRSLGAMPLLGRTLTPEDDAPGGPQVAVIAHSLWQGAFGGAADVLGRELRLDGTRFTVVGVMPDAFEFPPGQIERTEVWAPLQLDPANPGGRTDHGLSLVGRLRSGVTLAQAQSELAALQAHWGEDSGHRLDGTNHTVVCFGLHDETVRNVRPALRMLLGAVVFLLLIACVNVANLLLARAESRQREIAIRSALGAGPRSLGFQFLVEGALLAAAGVVVGLFLAWTGLELLKSAGLTTLPRAAGIGINAPVVLFAMAICGLTSVAFGLTPLLHVLRGNLQSVLKSTGAATTGTGGIQRFRQVLVVGQLALSLTLLIGTGLMLRAFWNLLEVPLGFDPKQVTAASIALPGSTYRGPEIGEFWTRLKGRLDALPGVEHAALASGLPPQHSSTHSDTAIEGYVGGAGRPPQNVEFYLSVSPGYFETMRIPLLEGRLLDARDDAGSPEVVMINQTMARTFWGEDSPVGRRIRPSGTTNWCTVVGVVADTRNAGLDRALGTEIYLPFTQPAGQNRARRMSVVVRAPGDPARIVEGLRRELQAMDPSLPLAEILTLEDRVAAARSRPQLLTLLLTLFANVALALAMVGIYGIISYTVAQRTKEFGLRMTLGARRSDVLGNVLGRGMTLAAAGIALGLAGAFLLTRFLASQLFGVTPTDPATFALVPVLFATVVFLATCIPARRATRIDPMEALRHE
ncbi:MAG: ABC transporter permease [Verrucomicrobia bacterium]|nr:ABC transporter permease [Verrucomicrobiota bacterium]